ncbi:MAG: hypothetical protein JWM44_1987 [Bacilli bacterium]|nr:hypothetical protein [Bacilli bacterium]
MEKQAINLNEFILIHYPEDVARIIELIREAISPLKTVDPQ